MRSSLTANITCSTRCGSAARDGKQGTPSTDSRPGLTANSAPENPPFSRFSTRLRPTVPGRSLAPTTAIEAGRSRVSSRCAISRSRNQKSAAGVARRRGGSKNAPSTTRQGTVTRDHCSSRW